MIAKEEEDRAEDQKKARYKNGPSKVGRAEEEEKI